MALWRGADLYRLFHQHEFEMQPAGLMPVRPVLKLPRVLGLVAPERTTHLPQRLVVNAVSGTDRLRMTFEAYDLANLRTTRDRPGDDGHQRGSRPGER